MFKAQPSDPAVLLMEPGNHTHSVREIQEKHRMAATPVLDLMVGLEIEQQKLEVVHHVEAIMQALELAIEIVEAIIGRLQQAAIIEKLEEVAIGKTIEEVAIGKIMEEVLQEEMAAMETRMEERETMAMVVLNPNKTTVHHQSSNHEATQASVLTRTAMVSRGKSGGGGGGGGCPGEVLEACIDVCPGFSARVFSACVAGCARRCPGRK